VRQRAIQEAETASAIVDRLNLLETTVERLQLDNSERQLAVLTAIEKVMHQLRAREAKRVRDAETEVAPEAVGYADRGFPVGAPVGAHRDNGSPLLAHVGNRFRRF
jgi:hypothetical protein